MEQFSLFLYVFDFISQKWKTIHRCHYFHEMQKKLSNFLSFSRSGLYFTNAVFFHEVENVSRTPTVNKLFLKVDKCLMNCIIAK